MPGSLWDTIRGVFSGKAAPEPEPEAPRRPAAARPPTLWRAVTIEAGPGRCAAAEAMLGKRFLAKEAPPLPLPGCNSQLCQCRYKHLEDRRSAATGVWKGVSMVTDNNPKRRKDDPGEG
jgi:hypothetical protein